ncbi:MAG: hypothetical protein HQM15_02020 [Deltaproteobacteria bacterium]|nr:hypothetical protein [Deltaproteobacteria bacterium]
MKKNILNLLLVLSFLLPLSLQAEEKKIEEKKLEEVQKTETMKTETKCKLKFELSSWSAFYKSGKGQGQVTCDNGQSAEVAIRAVGGGITFGKTKITEGSGSFSKVKDISEIFGSYVASEAHAGIVKSGQVQAMTKGSVSLALSGKGKGYDLGFAFGRFKISSSGEVQSNSSVKEKDLKGE